MHSIRFVQLLKTEQIYSGYTSFIILLSCFVYNMHFCQISININTLTDTEMEIFTEGLASLWTVYTMYAVDFGITYPVYDGRYPFTFFCPLHSFLFIPLDTKGKGRWRSEYMISI